VGGAPLVIAHRGAAAEAPENTIEAFDLSVFLGADALELDVQQAGDGTLVVIHDSTVDRTTEADGPVAGFGGAELERLGVPALEEVLERYAGLEITVDVKASSATAEVVVLIERLERTPRTILYVEEGTSLGAFATYGGRRATSSRQAAWLAAELADGAGAATELPQGFPEVVHAPLDGPDGPIVTAELVAAAQRVGRTVQVWTIDDPGRMRRLCHWGVDGIITNDVRRAVELLKEDDEAS
jgi:glycerophosphoryl diester phosphodiesterase